MSFRRPRPTSSAEPFDGRVVQAKDRITEAARIHFFAHGFQNVTMEDLARGIGMSKKTLYAHFPKKADLVSAVIEAKFAEADRDLAGVAALASHRFSEGLAALLHCLQRHTQEIKPPFLRDVSRESPALFGKIRLARKGLCQRHIGAFLIAGRKAGEVRKDFPAERLVEILTATLDCVMNPQKLEELDLSPKTAMATLIALFLEGALVRETRRQKS